ncbi:phosphate acetyltransferase [Georgenia sp. TF02-10]|uniref:phosphate acetyltransferase n=1 Tax=Georgenia sp. TF02-10 TaxID=2917725 RepID=UPI001FA7F558|nr:phosphate acetyltransferase [Georgenia sp. TF02-10]UNX54287.1 phosphate acetyltransferase [Georgenia sp. TF02-10]
MTARSIFITSPEGYSGKSIVALGLLDLLNRRVGRVGVFRPVTRSVTGKDEVVNLLLRHTGVDLPYDACVGVTYEAVHADPEAALATIVERYREVERACEVVVVVGSDYTDVAGPTELAFNVAVAANLGAPVLLVVSGNGRTPAEVRQVAEVAAAEIAQGHATTAGVLANRCDPGALAQVRQALEPLAVPVWALPDVPLLSAPVVADIMAALDGELVLGDPALLDREAEHMLVSGMSTEHVLERLRDGQLCIAAGDRPEVLITLATAHAAEGFPSLAGIVLNGGYRPSASVLRLVQGLGQRLPVILTAHNTYEAASIVAGTRGMLARGTRRKIDLALGTFEQHIDSRSILRVLDVPRSPVVTPLMFESTLLERARAGRRRIVLPEGDDDRILRAASSLLSRQVADLTILGSPAQVRAQAAELGLDLDAASVIDPEASELLAPFAEEYARLRAHKGMTLDRAREIVRDPSYFGTLMVHLGHADGMVSGAAHTTAHTIKPSFEIIKTRPGTSIVSSVFLMCLADRVLVYGDCAVNPDPTAEQLADIAISSAETAAQFGVEPRVAMLSYSTGESGSGADVEKVRRATALVKERRPDLSVEGPIQYDAAVDASVARAKMPGSAVAGRATVFVFPDLNTGNNTYKAVQRSAGAVAIGPVLQGLNKPVNDLSRGALVQDIVNTVAITAVQAQAEHERAARAAAPQEITA